MKAAIFLVIFFGLRISAIAQSSAKGYIGLALADAPGARGAVVGMVKPGGPADHAGVKPCDIVVAIQSQQMGRRQYRSHHLDADQ